MELKKEKMAVCLNCNHKQNVEGKTAVDELGEYAVCEECNSSFDV